MLEWSPHVKIRIQLRRNQVSPLAFCCCLVATKQNIEKNRNQLIIILVYGRKTWYSLGGRLSFSRGAGRHLQRGLRRRQRRLARRQVKRFRSTAIKQTLMWMQNKLTQQQLIQLNKHMYIDIHSSNTSKPENIIRLDSHNGGRCCKIFIIISSLRLFNLCIH